MFFSIKYKLLLAILLTNFLLVVAMYFVSIWNFERGFIDYLNQAEAERLEPLSAALADEYAENGSLYHLQKQRKQWRELIITHVLPDERRHADNPLRSLNGASKKSLGISDENLQHGSSRETEMLSFDPRLLLLDKNEKLIIGNPGKNPEAVLRPIYFENKVIGYLGVVRQHELKGKLEKVFAKNQQSSFGSLLIALFVLSVSVALPLAINLVSPIRQLVNATHDLTSGKYSARIEVRQRDELGLLANDFNMLAKTLENNQKVRQQWIADISHELRTPLAILKGEIEAIQDGVRDVTPERIASLVEEVNQLSMLVDDLYTLTLSDLGGLGYKKSAVIISDILVRVVKSFTHELEARNIKVSTKLDYTGTVFADEQRLTQLFNNLMQNTLRYTDVNGELSISLASGMNSVSIIWSDSSPGVSEDDLGNLFERFYRADYHSRNRQVAGAGLGLSICKNIVDAHEGSIVARHSPLGGLEIAISMPLKG